MSEPVGQVNEQYIVGGDNVTISCSVEYYGPETPYIEWTDENDEVVDGATEWTENNNDTDQDNVTSVRVSELSLFVPHDAEFLPPYTCSVRFYSYDQRPTDRRTYYSYYHHSTRTYSYYESVYTAYNWTSPETKVSCEYNRFHRFCGILM